MRIYDVLYAMNTGNASPKARPFDNLLGQALGGEVEKTTTGNPVSIITNRAQNAISTLLSFSPKQSGSGDPSPINIRPIEGWTEANLGINSETPTLTISLGGTYYGGTVDIERGVLRATHTIVDMGTLTWSRTTSYQNPVLYAGLSDKKNDSTARLVCDTYFARNYAYGSAQTFAENASDLQCAASRTNAQVYFRDDSYTSASDFKTAMSGHYIAYPLAEPLEIPLTPQTVALLSGANTLWTDGDEISITYKAKR